MTKKSPSTSVKVKPRKTPRQSRAGNTIAILLEAAARVLETKGMAGFNTNAVAQRAGVSIGSLYQYFPGKDGLIVALCQRERSAFLAEAQEALQQPTGQAALLHLIQASVQQQLQRPTLARLLDFEEGRPEINRELAPFLDDMHGLIRQLLVHDDIPPQPSVEIASDDIMAIARAMVNAAGERGEVDREALAQRISLALFGYLQMTVAT